MEFDENKAIKYIKTHATDEAIASYNDDDILLVIDSIFNYFEKYDECEDFDDDLQNITRFVKQQLAKDKDNVINLNHVKPIVEAELAYEDSLSEEL